MANVPQWEESDSTFVAMPDGGWRSKELKCDPPYSRETMSHGSHVSDSRFTPELLCQVGLWNAGFALALIPVLTAIEGL